MKLLNYLVLSNIFFSIAYAFDAGSIVIRPAIDTDLLSALHLDSHIMIEYFKPLFIEQYPETLGKDPDYFLSLDLEFDAKFFYQCINRKRQEKLYVACDQKTQQVVGIIVFHQESHEIMEIDLLFVHKKYQRMGIGKRLFKAACDVFHDTSQWSVLVFSKNKDALAFYASLGFNIVGPGPADKNMIYGLSYADVCVCCVSTQVD